ncbi:MAG TPA: DUF2480 family protein [Cyclobacteriaceae bacterium]|nr:DUF2480 family protein [Cyclobacteriaceae bacterium]
MENEIINRVANSALVTLDLQELGPKEALAEIDLKDILFQGQILREKDLRDFVKNHDWQQYNSKIVAVYCSTDAIIPTWAYMLLAVALSPVASRVGLGTRDMLLATIFKEKLDKVDWEKFRDAKVVIKGCSDVHVPESAYVEATVRLRPLASSILYGEPCSTVPLFKRPK